MAGNRAGTPPFAARAGTGGGLQAGEVSGGPPGLTFAEVVTALPTDGLDRPVGTRVWYLDEGVYTPYDKIGSADDAWTIAGEETASVFSVTYTDATTSIAPDLLTLSHFSSGTAAAGFGSSILFRGQDASGSSDDMARIAVYWSNPTGASEVSAIGLQTRGDGASLAQIMTAFGSSGAGSSVHFHTTRIHVNSGFRFVIGTSTTTPNVGSSNPLYLGAAQIYVGTQLYGTAAAPSYSWDGDLDTGMYRDTADEVAFAIGAAEGMRLRAPADGETAMLVRRNVGGAFSLQRVSMGAADSGGAGFKVLRVPN